MSFRVKLSSRAAADFEQTLSAVSERSPALAQRLNERFEKALHRLRHFPFACGLAYENPSFSEELRHLLFGIHPKR
jgi:plasmid stabilization system protein ParE